MAGFLGRGEGLGKGGKEEVFFLSLAGSSCRSSGCLGFLLALGSTVVTEWTFCSECLHGEVRSSEGFSLLRRGRGMVAVKEEV